MSAVAFVIENRDKTVVSETFNSADHEQSQSETVCFMRLSHCGRADMLTLHLEPHNNVLWHEIHL